jgi:Tol biopolymer transport system component
VRGNLARLLIAASGFALVAGPVRANAPTTVRVSVSSSGSEATYSGYGGSLAPAISADGRYVAFESRAADLVPGDTNGVRDIFVRDRSTGETRRASLTSSGKQADRASHRPAISANGRYIAFDSKANLVAADTNGRWDVYVWDRSTGETRRASVASSGRQADKGSRWPAISANGRYVAFNSYATNLVARDRNGKCDVFVRDRSRERTRRVSVSSSGTEGDVHSEGCSGSGSADSPAISANGRYVAFDSPATNLVAGDTNGWVDVFVRDRAAGETRRVSVGPTGRQGNFQSWASVISADGRYVAFSSLSTNLVAGDTNTEADVFVRDLVTGETQRVSVASSGAEGDRWSGRPAISADGRHVAFSSNATNLVAGDTNDNPDVFVRDLVTGETERMSVASTGAEGDRSSGRPAISADGRHVAFESEATNLVAGDTNGIWDVFVRDRSSG